MNGPWHYRKALETLQWAFSGQGGDPYSSISAAQAHAFLALAAATVDTDNPDLWRQVAESGPHQYVEAEKTLRGAYSGEVGDPYCALAAAQVFAMLALVAAGVDTDSVEEWREAVA